MDLPWVQQMGAVLPWRRAAPFYGPTAQSTDWMYCCRYHDSAGSFTDLLHGIQVGCAAPIVTVAWDLLQVSMLLQIRQCPFDRGA